MRTLRTIRRRMVSSRRRCAAFVTEQGGWTKLAKIYHNWRITCHTHDILKNIRNTHHVIKQKLMCNTNMPNIQCIRAIHVRHRRYCTNHNNRAHHNIAHHNTVVRNTSHVIFLTHFARHVCVHTNCMAQDEPSLKKCLWCAFHSILMSSLMCGWAFVGCLLSFSLTCFSPSFISILPHSTWSLPGTPSSMSTTPRVKTAAHPHNE